MEAALEGYPFPDGFALVSSSGDILEFGELKDDDGTDLGWVAYVAETGALDPPLATPFRVQLGLTGGEVRDRVDKAIERLRKERRKLNGEAE